VEEHRRAAEAQHAACAQSRREGRRVLLGRPRTVALSRRMPTLRMQALRCVSATCVRYAAPAPRACVALRQHDVRADAP